MTDQYPLATKIAVFYPIRHFNRYPSLTIEIYMLNMKVSMNKTVWIFPINSIWNSLSIKLTIKFNTKKYFPKNTLILYYNITIMVIVIQKL